jgi:3-hydroxyisobutyrate dehydrogenase
MAKRVGFIGLGMMGTPMSKNLVKAGFEVTVWNRTAEKMAPVVAAGARAAKSPRDAAEKSDVVLTMLSGPAEVEAVVHGPDGVAQGLRAGAVLIDMTTSAPDASQRLAAALARRGAAMLDAPVSGSVGVAANAALTIQVGGEATVFAAQRDVLAAMGKNIFHVGGPGMGCFVKLVGNAIMGANLAVLAEGLALGARGGVPTEVMIEVLKQTGAASAVLERRGGNILKDDYTAQFMLKLLFKDLGLALDAAADAAVPMPVVGVVRQLYAHAMAQGRGNADMSAIAATTAGVAGVSLKARSA